MLTCCICDDNFKDLEETRAMLENFSRARPEYSLAVDTFSSAYDLLEHLETRGGFDLYLLDILMPQMAGMDLARHIRVRKEPSEIMFLTVSREYALEAFDMAACDYLIKPIGQERFERAMLRAAGRLASSGDSLLLLKTREGLFRLPCRELVVVESFNHDRVCTLSGGARYVTSDTLTSLMERLGGDPRFFSPHRAYNQSGAYHRPERRQCASVQRPAGPRGPGRPARPETRLCGVPLPRGAVIELFLLRLGPACAEPVPGLFFVFSGAVFERPLPPPRRKNFLEPCNISTSPAVY